VEHSQWRPIDEVIHLPTSDQDTDPEIGWGTDRSSTVLRWQDAMPIWHSASRCRSIVDWDEIYFGENPASENDEDAPARRASMSTQRFRQAQATCAGCPVIEQCARHAITQPELYGIWAGTQPGMRDKARDLITSGIITLEEAIEVICEGAVQTFKELADALDTGLKDVI
jgi:hypothetical protein